MNYNGRTKMDYWKDWLGRNASAAEEELSKMDRRESLYRGEIREITPLTERDRKKNSGKYDFKYTHFYNLQISASLLNYRTSAGFFAR